MLFLGRNVQNILFDKCASARISAYSIDRRDIFWANELRQLVRHYLALDARSFFMWLSFTVQKCY